MFVVWCVLIAVRCWLFVVGCLLLVVCGSLLVACSLVIVVYCLLFWGLLYGVRRACLSFVLWIVVRCSLICVRCGLFVFVFLKNRLLCVGCQMCCEVCGLKLRRALCVLYVVCNVSVGCYVLLAVICCWLLVVVCCLLWVACSLILVTVCSLSYVRC